MHCQVHIDQMTYCATLLCGSDRNSRVGWRDQDVPLTLVGRVAPTNRSGWRSMLVPSNDVQLVDVAKTIRDKQIKWAQHRRISLNSASATSKVPAAYVQSLEDNLFQALDRETRAEFNAGDGRELDGHMRAVYSSSALACNVFAFWRLSSSDFLN